MEDISRYKQYLLTLDYPNILNLNDIQVAKVFMPENRLFFLTWVFKKLYNFDINPTMSLKEKQTLLSKRIYQNGFCSSAQALKFVLSDMSITAQLQIFDRIFVFMELPNSISENIDPPADKNSEKPIDLLSEMKELASLDVNLFPAFGPIKHVNNRDRQQEIQQEIQELKDQFAELKIKLEEFDNCTHPPSEVPLKSEDNREMANEFIRNIQVFHSSALAVLKYRQSSEKSCVAFSENFAEITNNGYKSMRAIYEHFKYCETLQGIMIDVLCSDTPEEETRSLIHNLYKMSLDTVNNRAR